MPRDKPSRKPAITVDVEVRRGLLVRDGLQAVAEWEQEHGPLTEAELDAARRRISADLAASARARSA